MSKKSGKISAASIRRQDQAAHKESVAPKGFNKLSPKGKAKAILSEPIVGGPSSAGSRRSGSSSSGSGNWRTERRDYKGRFTR